MRVVAVMPAYNEAGRIGAVVRAVVPEAAAVVVVCDGSTDATAAQAAAAGAVVLRHAINRGQGAALRTGNAAALALGAEAVVHLDADGQHDPGIIRELMAPIEAGEADVVYGSRFLGVEAVGMPKSRRLALRLARVFSRLVLGVPRGFTDPQSGLRAMTAAAVRTLDFRQDRMAHASELMVLLGRSGLRWREIPAEVRYSAETLAKGQAGTTSNAVIAARIVWQLILDSLG
jgi:glycosyltransferase involved in cell wall biosynthesis